MNRARDAHVIIGPTDLNQAYVKVVIATAFFVWAGVNDGFNQYWTTTPSPLVTLIYLYVLYVAASLYYAKFSLAKSDNRRSLIEILRYAGMCGDLVACGGAVYFAGIHALVLYPIFVTVIIGYGFRFGLRFLFLGVFIAFPILLWLIYCDPFLNQHHFVSITFLFGILLIPLYSAFLLAKYQTLLYELEKSNLARTRFIANMSHEFRTPLNSIYLNIETLRENLALSKPKNFPTRPLEIISESSSYLKRLVNRVLEVSSIEAGLFSLGDSQNFDLYKVLASSIDIAGAEALQKNVSVSLHVGPNVPQYIVGWEQQMSEILINVIANAAKFTSEGGIRVRVVSETNDDPSRGCLEISVVDSGIGMTQAQLLEIFEPFVVGDDSRTRPFEGTGIGLTLTKQYVDALDGSIKIRSEYQTGTEVIISLPYVVGQEIESHSCASFGGLLVSADHLENLSFSHTGLTRVSLSEYIENEKNYRNVDCLFVHTSVSQYFSQLVARGKIKSGTSLFLIGEINDAPETQDYVRLHIPDLSKQSRRAVSSLCSLDETNENDEKKSKQLRILLIDDNEINLESLSLTLQNAGHVPTLCSGADDALNLLKQSAHDLLIIDMHMPDYSGVEIIEMGRKLTNSSLPPIIMLTADITADAERDAKDAGVNAFLTKPISPGELRKVVDMVCSVDPSGQGPILNLVRDGAQKKQFDNIDELLQSGASKEDVAEILEKFSVDFDAKLLDCCIAAFAGRHHEVKKLTHKLLGSAAAMHFGTLVDMLKNGEGETDEERTTQFLESLESYKWESVRLKNELDSYLFRKN